MLSARSICYLHVASARCSHLDARLTPGPRHLLSAFVCSARVGHLPEPPSVRQPAACRRPSRSAARCSVIYRQTQTRIYSRLPVPEAEAPAFKLHACFKLHSKPLAGARSAARSPCRVPARLTYQHCPAAAPPQSGKRPPAILSAVGLQNLDTVLNVAAPVVCPARSTTQPLNMAAAAGINRGPPPSGLAGALGRGAQKRRAPGWGARCCKISGR